MSLYLSKLLQVCSFKYKSPELEKEYQDFKTRIQTSLFQLLRFLLPSLLIFFSIYSRAHSLPFSNSLFHDLYIIPVFAACLVLLIPKKSWSTFQNFALVLILCFVELLAPLDTLLGYDQDDRTLMFLLGYTFGTIEVLLASAIKNPCFRLWAQAILTLSKILNFSPFTGKDSVLLLVLGCMGFLLLTFLTYHDVLERKNYKTKHDSSKNLLKLQTILADDFPISVIIISADLKQIFYSNQYFTQNFLQSSHLLNQNEPIEILFKKIMLEFDEINRQTPLDLGRISLHTFITETMNTHPRFNNRDVFNLYSLYQDKDVSQRHYEMKLRKIIWEDSVAYTIIFNDVSDKQKATALQEADEQRDRVITTITHELKTPINGILGLLDIVNCRSQDPISKTYLDHCKNCSKLLLHLVNSIMDLSQLRQNKLHIEKSVFSLDELLKEMKSLYAFTSEHRGLQFIIEKSSEVPNYIYTDKYRLISILVQLLGNAMKFTFKGFVKLKVQVSLQKLIFIIEDSGVGIKQEDQINLSNMFGQITEKNKNINHHGAGLGITIANELIHILSNSGFKKEQIGYESVLTKGSVFTFRIDFLLDGAPKSLNITEDDSFSENTHAERGFEVSSLEHSIKAIERSILVNRKGLNATSKRSLESLDAPKPDENKKRVLIVDDNPFNLVAASFIVSKLGFESLTASNGHEAIGVLQESVRLGHHFNFVLMDIQMPIMDGIQATQNISQMIQMKELYYLPVIALTAKNINNQEKKIYKDSGMFDALGKPLVDQELKEILKRFSK